MTPPQQGQEPPMTQESLDRGTLVPMTQLRAAEAEATRLRKIIEVERLLAQEQLIVDATEEICRLLDEADMNRAAFAQELGLSRGRVSQLLSGEQNMTLRTLADMAFVLGYHFEVSLAELKKGQS